MFEALLNAFRAPDLRRRILYVLGILVVFRLLAHVPVPGVDREQLTAFLDQNAIFGLLNLFSGGGLSNFSVVALGVNPYINASIIMQLMTGVVPSLQALQREGEYGRQKINQYTRYLSVPMALLQSYGFLALLSANNVLATPFDLGSWETITQIVTLTAGSITLMWLGELITEKGIGNGISFIIFAGIVSQAPGAIGVFIDSPDLARFVLFAGLGIAAVAVIIFIQEGQRRIPIQYASRVRGRRMYQGGQTFLPLRVNQAGVIPIIFAVSILLFPSQIASYFVNSPSPVGDIAQGIVTWLSPGSWLYVVLYFLLTFGFTYFYTAFTFKPDETAEQLRKNGGFIPGHPAGASHAGLPRTGGHADHRRRRPLPGHRRGRTPVHRPRPAGVPEYRAGWHEPPDRRVGRRRDDEAARSPAPYSPVRGLHSVNVVVLLGAPGAGKGTQAPLLATHLGIPVVATGDLFRAAVRDGTPLGLDARRYMDAGQLVPDEIVVRLLLDRLGRAGRGRGRHPRRLPADRGPGEGARRCARGERRARLRRRPRRRARGRGDPAHVGSLDLPGRGPPVPRGLQPAARRRARATSTGRSSTSARTTSPTPSATGWRSSSAPCTTSSTTTATSACSMPSTGCRRSTPCRRPSSARWTTPGIHGVGAATERAAG